MVNMTDGERRRWHLSRSVDLGHLLMTLAMLAGFMVWAMRQESRMTTLEVGLRGEHDINLQQDSERNRQQDQTRSDLKAINDKLDRLLESRHVR